MSPPDLHAFLKANRRAEVLGVYDGRERVGTVVEVGGGAAAFDALGNALGTFRKRLEALAAVPVPLPAGEAPVPSQEGGS
jgi:hypothetical protein